MINWEKVNIYVYVMFLNVGVLSIFEYDVRIGNVIKKLKKKIFIGMINFFFVFNNNWNFFDWMIFV